MYCDGFTLDGAGKGGSSGSKVALGAAATDLTLGVSDATTESCSGSEAVEEGPATKFELAVLAHDTRLNTCTPRTPLNDAKAPTRTG